MIDCADGSDENSTLCRNRTFLLEKACKGEEETGFLCNDDIGSAATTSLECISSTQVCDGEPDCSNNRDEINCSPETGCPFSTCHECLEMEKWCDGVDDCPDGTDESHDFCLR